MSGQRNGQGQRGRTRRILPGVAIGAVVGLALGIGGTVLGLPFWLLLPVAMAVIFVAMFRRSLASVTSVPDGDVPCPRCGHEPRTAAGWCPSCTTLLAGVPVRADHPIHAFAATLMARDVVGAGRQVDDHLTLSIPNGQSRRLTRAAWQRGARVNFWIYPDQRTELIGLHGDPADSSTVWVRTHDVGKARPGFPDLDAELVTRYHLSHDLISEIETFPALPKA